jgi:hypothetical protein
MLFDCHNITRQVVCFRLRLTVDTMLSDQHLRQFSTKSIPYLKTEPTTTSLLHTRNRLSFVTKLFMISGILVYQEI